MRRGGTSGLPVAKNCSCSSARHSHLRVQPLMPQLMGLSFSLGAMAVDMAVWADEETADLAVPSIIAGF